MSAKHVLLSGVLLVSLTILTLNVTNSPSGAAPPLPTIDLVGTYVGTAEMISWVPMEPGYVWQDPYEFSFEMEITAQQGHLFWGTMDGETPICGAVMSPEGTATAFCIRGYDGHGYGSLTVIPGRGNKPDQVVIEMLLTASPPDSQWPWSAYGRATKQTSATIESH